MSIVKQWVFPTLRIIGLLAIAAALIKIAFFPGDNSTEPLEPGGELTSPQVEVTRGSIFNEIWVSGSVVRNPNVEAKSTVMGTITSVGAVAVNNPVTAGQSLYIIEYYDDRGRKQTTRVTSPVDGVIKRSGLIKGQPVSIGEVLAEIAPESFHVSAMIEPTQLYRLLEAPTEGMVSITGGPAPFTCTNLRVDSGENGSTLTCLIPTEIRVFPSLPAQLTITAGSVEDVLVIPTTAVEGGAESGNVWVVLPDGTEEVRTVVLGMSDGAQVEVLEGLSEGEMILQFVPGADALPDDGGIWLRGGDGQDNCVQQPDGSIACLEG